MCSASEAPPPVSAVIACCGHRDELEEREGNMCSASEAPPPVSAVIACCGHGCAGKEEVAFAHQD